MVAARQVLREATARASANAFAPRSVEEATARHRSACLTSRARSTRCPGALIRTNADSVGRRMKSDPRHVHDGYRLRRRIADTPVPTPGRYGLRPPLPRWFWHESSAWIRPRHSRMWILDIFPTHAGVDLFAEGQRNTSRSFELLETFDLEVRHDAVKDANCAWVRSATTP